MHFVLFLILLMPALTGFADTLTLGRVETGLLSDQCIRMRIKMDTGAKTSSVNGHNITLFDKDGEKWVKFILDPDRTPTIYTLELPLIRTVKIRKRASEAGAGDPFEIRPVVLLPVTIGKQTHSVEVSLANRSHFNYGMILGRTAMEAFNIHINPQTAFTVKPVCPYEKKVVN